MGNFLSRAGTEMVIHVQTGDRRYSGTDSKIDVILEDEFGNKSGALVLNSFAKNDFERGSYDSFQVPAAKISTLQRNAKIMKIELRKEMHVLDNDWFVDKIVVENKSTNRFYPFPVLRWMRGEQTYFVKLYDTSLPQYDEFVEQRLLQLQDKQKEYELAQHIPNGPIQAKSLPKDEDFSFSYKWNIGTLKLKLTAMSTVTSLTNGEFTEMGNMYDMFDGAVFTVPESAEKWDDDIYFGIQRVARLNHSVIQLVTKIPEKLPVTDDILKPFLDGCTIREAIEVKKLFIVDLKLLDGIPHKEGMVVCAPIALFFVDPHGRLKPVAIQLNQTPGQENPIFTPNVSPKTWSLAKMWFNNADACYHQSLTHLGLTHLLMEGFCLASNRHLSQSHPIFKLLAPHFLYIIAINTVALTTLLSEGGWVDQMLNCGRDGMLEIVRRGFDSWRLNVEGTLPEDLKRRGLDDPDVLPCYHYRDDGILIYNAIHKYVAAYVNLYYPNPEMLKKDREIQAWAKELVKPKNQSKGGTGYQGIPGHGVISNNNQLITILTSIIYTCSVAHAATNFPQYEEYAFPPKYPATMKGKPPTDASVQTTDEDLLRHLANQDEMLSVMSMTKILSAKGTKSLGDFEVQFVYDPRACELVEAFRKELVAVSRTITERNTTRDEPYIYLDPYMVPNAISI